MAPNHPGLRPGLLSARAVQISSVVDSVVLILLAKMSFNLVFRNQVGVDREVLRGGALYQGTTLVGPFYLEKSWALAPVLLCLIGTWPLGFAAVFAVYRG